MANFTKVGCGSGGVSIGSEDWGEGRGDFEVMGVGNEWKN